MNWKNVDLNSPYESSQKLLDSYSFDTLLLEVHCNLKEITPETVRKQALESIKSNYQSALQTLEDNLLNITNKAKEERAKP